MTDFNDDAPTATYKARIVGAKAAKGEFKDDAGKVIVFDSTKVYARIPLRGDNACGVATVEYKVGPASLFETLRFKQLLDGGRDFIAELEVRKTTNGKEEIEEVIGFRVLPASNHPVAGGVALPAGQAKAA